MNSDVKVSLPPLPSKLSVITPSLNHGRFLRETIESILSQTYKNIEHVIADGASTDGMVDILKEYPHIKWISEKEEGDNGVWMPFGRLFTCQTVNSLPSYAFPTESLTLIGLKRQ